LIDEQKIDDEYFDPNEAYEEFMEYRMKDFREFNRKLSRVVGKVPKMKEKLNLLKENMAAIRRILNFFS